MKSNACEIQVPDAYTLVIKMEELNLFPFKSDSEKKWLCDLWQILQDFCTLIKTDYHYLHFLLSLVIELLYFWTS